MANLRRRDFLKLGAIGLAALAASIVDPGVDPGRSAHAAQPPAPVQESEQDMEIHWTPVHWVRALVNVNIRTGPSTRYRRIGLLGAGQRVFVLGRSTNWRWWCIRWGRRTAWVSADPHLTRPVRW